MKRLTNKDLVIAPDPILKKRLKKVEFPLSEEYKLALNRIHQYIYDSYDEELAKEFDLTPSVGMAANQVGLDARMFVICILTEEDEVVLDEVFINPVILSSSVEESFVESGEGCLSIPSHPEGYVYRPRKIKIRYQDIDGNTNYLKLDDFESIAVQHEIDHLNGILYSDRINQDDPFEVRENAYTV